MTRRRTALVVAASLALLAGAAQVPAPNGFRLEPTSVPVEEILPGGPPRDGIPALDHPAHIRRADPPWPDEEPVIAVVLDGEARAYPLSILDWHELVNDTLGDRPILVSYCPLCGTAMVFDRRVDGETRRFGVSGLLYRSDLLLYDHESESLWSQIASKAVAGPATGKRLKLLPSTTIHLADWRSAHPETTVLSRETGHRRPYGQNPYDDYATSERLIFPMPVNPSYHPKMPTIGIRTAGAARAYPAAEVVRAGGTVEETFADGKVRVHYDPERQTFSVDAPGPIEVIEGYWFAWMAFHPESSVFRSSPPAGEPAVSD